MQLSSFVFKFELFSFIYIINSLANWRTSLSKTCHSRQSNDCVFEKWCDVYNKSAAALLCGFALYMICSLLGPYMTWPLLLWDNMSLKIPQGSNILFYIWVHCLKTPKISLLSSIENQYQRSTCSYKTAFMHLQLDSNGKLHFNLQTINGYSVMVVVSFLIFSIGDTRIFNNMLFGSSFTYDHPII
jgi:hypothetical protein